MNHTPTPSHITIERYGEGHGHLKGNIPTIKMVAPFEVLIVSIGASEKECHDYAAYIVKCVNSYEKLKQAIRGLEMVANEANASLRDDELSDRLFDARQKALSILAEHA